MAWQRTGPTAGLLTRLWCWWFDHDFDVYKRHGPWIKLRGGVWCHKVKCRRCGILVKLVPAVMSPEDERED